jgi:hypothetical protein
MILWRLPTQIADWRLSVGNAEELGDAIRDETLDRSFFRFDNGAQFLFVIRPGGRPGLLGRAELLRERRS